MRPLLVFENLDTAPRRHLFGLWGVAWTATPWAWLSPLCWSALGVALALAQRDESAPRSILLDGAVYGILLYACNTIHTLGHVAAGRLVRAPMDANLLTATRDVNLYTTPRASIPRAARIGRALGGPLANLLMGALGLAAGHALSVEWLRMFGWFGLLISGWTLLPIPTLDGWRIWGAVLRRDRDGR